MDGGGVGDGKQNIEFDRLMTQGRFMSAGSYDHLEISNIEGIPGRSFHQFCWVALSEANLGQLGPFGQPPLHRAGPPLCSSFTSLENPPDLWHVSDGTRGKASHDEANDCLC